MPKHALSAAERRYLDRLHKLPCIVHWKCYGQIVKADEAHHLEHVRGDHSTYATVPACKSCHQELHEHRRRAFYLAHKLSDVKLLAWTIEVLAVMLPK